MIRLLLCHWLGFHQPPYGVSPRWSISFHCERCKGVIPGELATRRKRG